MKGRSLIMTSIVTVMICSLFLADNSSARSETTSLAGGTHVLTLHKSVPDQLNYQGYLIDAADSSGVTAVLEMTFRLLDSEIKGVELWSETHPAVDVQDGLFQVMLGGTTPFPAGLFDGSPLWLQTEVGAEVLMPRKPLASVAFSMRSGTADQAVIADQADTADFAAGAGYAASATEALHATHADTADFALTATGAVPPVPLMLSGSSNLPILRVANEGTGHGVAIDSVQGNGVYVDSAGTDGIRVRQAGAPTGIMVTSGIVNGVEVNLVTGYGLYVGNANRSGVRVYMAGTPSAGAGGPMHNGFEVHGAENCGLFVGHADSAGVLVNSSGDHGFAALEPAGDGLYVSIAGDCGVQVDSSSDDGIYIRDCEDDGIYIFNAHDDGLVVSGADNYGVYIISPGDDGVHITGADKGVYVSGADDDGVYVVNANDDGGYFDLSSSSTGWAVYAHSTGSTGNGMYCYGNGTITGSWSKTVATSKGWEAVQTLSAPDEEIVASGTGRLVEGCCRVDFERLFGESISPRVPVKVVVTPMDRWSGLYTVERSHQGFTVLTGAGAQDASFTWQAIGRRRGYEQRPGVTIPDPDEEEAAEAEEPDEDEYRHRIPRLRARRDRSSPMMDLDGGIIDQVPD